MAKWHIGKNGKPATCTAKTNSCPRGGNDEHFSSPEAAAIAAAKSGMKSALKSKSSNRTSIKSTNVRFTDTPGMVDVYGKTYSEHQAKALVEARETLGKFINMRAKFGDLIDNPKRTSAAVKRMNKLADYAMARGDEHAMKKMEGALLADKMHFEQPDGRVISVNDALRASANYKAWDDGNKKATAELSALAQDPSVLEGSYKFDGVTVKVEDGQYNSEYAKTLDKETLASISVVKDVPDINRAKERLAPERLDKVLSFETVAEVMDGRMEESRSEGVENFTPDNSGETAQEKFNNVGASYGSYVKHMQSTFGAGKTAVKKERDDVTKFLKEEANRMNEKFIAEHDKEASNKLAYSVEEKTGSGARNIVFGGRKHDTGILVSGRNKLANAFILRDQLTPEEMDAITVKKSLVDPDKAREVLSDEQLTKLFSARKVSLREATYKKPK